MKSTMSKIEDLGNAYVPTEDIQHWYKLVPVPQSSKDEDVVMDCAGTSSAATSSMGTHGQSEPEPTQLGGEEQSESSHDNLVVSFIDVFGRVSNSVREYFRI